MTEEEINAIIANASVIAPISQAVRREIVHQSVVTSEESVADANAAFLEALGEAPEPQITDSNQGDETLEQASTLPQENSYIGVSNGHINTRFNMEDPFELVDSEEPEPEDEEEPVVPRNSRSLDFDETTSRFSDAIWYKNIQNKIITLAGLGGIGSYVAFLLARMKPKALYLYDEDSVEAANMSGQLYGMNDVGSKKVNAMVSMVANYANYQSTFAISEMFTEESEASDIMICGFDNMQARYMYFNKWYTHVESKSPEERKRCLFIDGRLAAESMQVFCITGDDDYNKNNYKNNWLFSDSQADITLCSYKQTTFCANMIGSIMVNLFVNFCANECNPLMPRDLPFMTSYEAETMYFKTKN